MRKAIELATNLDDKADHVVNKNDELRVMRESAQELRRLAAIEHKYLAIMALDPIGQCVHSKLNDGGWVWAIDSKFELPPDGLKIYVLPKDESCQSTNAA